MAVLRVSSGLVIARLVGQILLAEDIFYAGGYLGARLLGDSQRVGSHVGYKTGRADALNIDALIELLRGAHGLLSLETQLPRSLLLEGGGGKGRRGVLLPRALFEGFDGIRSAVETAENSVRLLFVLYFYLAVFVAVERCGKHLAGRGGELCVYRPIFLGLERTDLLLAVNYHAHRDALNAAGGKSAAYLLRNKRAQAIADESVEYSSRLLCVDEIHVDGARMIHAVLDSGFGYLVEGDSVLVLKIEIEQGRKVPRYRFSLAIRVGCEDNFIAFFNIFFQLADELLFSFYNGVFRREVVLDIDAQLRRGQVADMTHRGDYLIAGSEIFFNCLRLCGRLDYN